ncbi:MAG: carboxynorspermidine decarboxylase [Oligoflexales bacterium]|nr:carboxynorspermidine decarboxylase [Oligoflexales bacterium]
MARDFLEELKIKEIETPCFVVDRQLIRKNLAILDSVQEKAGCRILLALKGFAMFSVFPEIRKVLAGTCASGVYEARLGREEFGGEVHSFAPAYTDEDIAELIQLSDHIVFNSFGQWERYRPVIKNSGKHIECGLRVNPECSVGHTAIYDPCSPRSRLGIRAGDFPGHSLQGISGLHFHALCEQNAYELARVLSVFEERFGAYLGGLRWVNFGGGHHITRDDYDIDLLCRLVRSFKERYAVAVYLEPGEAVALNTGVLVTSVVDIIDNEGPIAILDSSASAHMPDVLEMPYRPNIVSGGHPGEKRYTYRLAGITCLAGDVIGDYSFDYPLEIGGRLVFLDMAHYSMVKTTMFNGVRHPAIALFDSRSGDFHVVKKFGYVDYKNRLS